jgi:hypothetical protein
VDGVDPTLADCVNFEYATVGLLEVAMDRERQIELIKSAEERAVGYLRAWIARDPAVKAELHKSRRPKEDGRPAPAAKKASVTR